MYLKQSKLLRFLKVSKTAEKFHHEQSSVWNKDVGAFYLSHTEQEHSAIPTIPKNSCMGHSELYCQMVWRHKVRKHNPKHILGNKNTTIQAGSSIFALITAQIISPEVFPLSDSAFIYSCNCTCRLARQGVGGGVKAEFFSAQLTNPAINPECHFVILLYCVISKHAFSLQKLLFSRTCLSLFIAIFTFKTLCNFN